MYIVYNEGTKEPYTGPYEKMPATKIYLKHFENALYLKFIANNLRSTLAEKHQAHLELAIADKKMVHWRGHPKYDHEVVLRECERLKKQWSHNP